MSSSDSKDLLDSRHHNRRAVTKNNKKENNKVFQEERCKETWWFDVGLKIISFTF